jgi:thymidine kinase
MKKDKSVSIITITQLKRFTCLEILRDLIKDQTYNNIIEWCDIYNKTVICAGLDGDFQRNPFGDVLRLIPHADKVEKLSALCKRCGNGTSAHFTKKIIEDFNTKLVGSYGIYEAVCRTHFLE